MLNKGSGLNMNICIVTIYNSPNYGAFLQAYVLYNVLKELGHEVTFLDTGARKQSKKIIKSTIKKIILFKFEKAYFELKKYWTFKKYIKYCDLCRKDTNSMNNQDIFVFGSDEIWNISRDEINKYPILFGVGIPDSYFVSYAPSINNTTLDETFSNQTFLNALQRFDKISARDKHSQKILNLITKKPVEYVLDPIFLYNVKQYETIEEKISKSGYILVYGYPNRFTSKNINEIIEYAKSKNLTLISVGNYFDWCDKNIAASPFEFLSYVRNARYVITNTYHGTIFSIRYCKQFASYAGSQIKVMDILENLELENQVVSESCTLENALGTNIDYIKVQEKLDRYIDDSYKYIHSFLENADKYIESRKKN